MKITITTKPFAQISCDLLVVRLFEGDKRLEEPVKELDGALGTQISAALAADAFRGQLNETYLIAPTAKIGPRRVLLLGMGKRREYDLERHRVIMSAIAPVLQKLKVKNLAVAIHNTLPKGADIAQTKAGLVDGLMLANYRFTQYKNFEKGQEPAPVEEVAFVFPWPVKRAATEKELAASQALCESVMFARDLGNHPGNIATPTHLAQHATEIARAAKNIRVKILERADMVREKMGAFLAVAQGSDEPPKFIILEYAGKKTAPKIVLVGKGITFDSGGISIKPSEKMEEMKYDMAGAAAVMGIIRAAAALKLRVNLVGLIPATENLPSGKALKPGDIIRARSGKTIEVVNTDAEGRLVLADALDYAKRYKPKLVIDFATLTGSIVTALGDDVAGAFTNTDSLMPKLQAAAKVTGEKIWPMPLETEYDQFIKSDLADLRNIGSVRFADAINGANFLKNFVDYPWIHLDIAGVAWATREKPYRPKGATGAGVRLTIEFLKKLR